MAALALVLGGIAASYTLESMDKWGNSFFQTFGPVSSTPGGPSSATVTWSYINDGAGFVSPAGPAHDIPLPLSGTSTLGTLRTSIDARYGNGAFDAAVKRAFAVWADAANVSFIQQSDNGAPFAGTTAIDIRIGAYAITGGADVGGIAYGPPRDATNFPDALAGDIAFSSGNSFQIAAGPDGAALPPVNGQYANDIEGLMLHEIGHALGLGHSADPSSVMCGAIFGTSVDGNQCTAPGTSYNVIHRQLTTDDVAGIRYLYGAAQASATDGPLPAWAYGVLGLGLLLMARHRSSIGVA